ncbi:MAG: dihydrolipoyl dehydrogenase [Mycobacterium sp.]|uniref:dihydrolipoyl dehydrogenase n=1 Tax=Mycobacterium sp. TaxID=1785 RepID=UPI00261F68F8|nr:dihydrolipoyl dehydrogenase [Mycobacterium sp.]MDI3315232.1 dihydrolipoyl dehydrogenase [Mycobacterium sp.]
MTVTSNPVDVAIIGAGGAGYPAAFRLAAAGRSGLMADPIGNLGGDCLAEGCVPSKAVRETALSYQRARSGPLAAITGPSAPDPLDAPSRWRSILRHKDAVQQARYDQHRKELDSSTVQFVSGRARVVGENELEVESDGGRVQRVGFHSLIIATGSAPSRLPIPGAELAVTSHELFRLGADLGFPQRPVIIGGGYIGVETATILAHLGAAPVVLELTEQLLPGFDRDLADFLARSLRGRVALQLGAAVTGIERSGTDLLVRYRRHADQEGTECSVAGDLVIMATGRVPVLPDGIEHLEVQLDRHRSPVVDATLRTTNPSVWAPGDVNGKSMLFHSAVRQSIVVAHNILAGGASADRMEFTAVPFTVFTDPELASVGLTEAKAVELHGDVAVGSYDYAVDARAQILGETTGYLKLVCDAHSARLLGAQIAGVDAAQLVAPLALALNEGLNARALAEVAFPHPMISEGINVAARRILV